MSAIVGQKPETVIDSSWGSSLNRDTDVALELVLPIPGLEIFYVDGLFTSEEAERLIRLSEDEGGYGYTNYPKSYRGNLRLITTDESLAEAVWARLQPHVPRIVTECGIEYEVVGLNPCWRLAKYFPGDQFKAHVDAFYESSGDGAMGGQKSMFTVNIYMNEGFGGGVTRFLFNRPSRERVSKKSVSKVLPPPISELPEILDVVPRTGRCLLFRQPPEQNYLHEGLLLESGRKYLFRSDVMYRIRVTQRRDGNRVVPSSPAPAAAAAQLPTTTPQAEGGEETV